MRGADPLRRLERRISLQLDARRALRRLARSLPAIAQIVAGVVIAYAFSRYVLGHELPIVAVTVTISALGFARDARPRRVLETVVGILVGIVVAALIVLAVGRGVWQLALILALALIVARLVSASTGFAVAAAVQSMLVAVLPDPEGGVFERAVDGLVGGVVALLVTALIPRLDVLRTRGESRVLFSLLVESLSGVAEALRRGDSAAAELALARSRRTQPLIDEWTTSLESARAVAAYSPWLRRGRARLAAEAEVLAVADLVTRHVRSIARRVEILVRDGHERPGLAHLLDEAAVIVEALGRSQDDAGERDRARVLGLAMSGELAPDKVPGAVRVPDQVVVVLLRSLVFDTLTVCGLTRAEARQALPPL
ncbi:MAG: FUSC family protein [Microcella sp.]